MEKLTPREEELMRCFWEHGPLFVRELVDLSPEPKPHFNTLSTMVRALEAKGYVAHKAFGSTYQYYPVVSESEFSRRTLGGVIRKYFENSYLEPSPRWSRRRRFRSRSCASWSSASTAKTALSHVRSFYI